MLAACGGRKQTSTAANDTVKAPTPIIKDTHTTTPTEEPEWVDSNNKQYNTLRQGFNKRIDKHPKLIAYCTTTAQVATAVRYAIEHELPIAIKSGGHSMEGFSCNDGGVAINLSGMNDVTLHPDNTVSVGPGCLLHQLYDALLPNGRLLPGGSCGTVAVGGLTLGGGYGIFSRRFGLTCDHLLESTMVDGSGNIVHTKSNPELLWALKGGGTGNFGVVTEMKFSTHAAPATLQAHYFKARNLDAPRAAAILRTWMEITPQMPSSCFSGYVLNGKTLNILVTNYDPENKALPSLLNKLASVTDTFRSSRIGTLHHMVQNYFGRPGPLNFRNSSAGFFKGYDDVAPFIESVFERIIHTPGMIYQVNTLGGKIKDESFETLSCYPHRQYDFISEVQGYWDIPAMAAPIAAATTEILKTTAQNGIHAQYVNYCSIEFENWETAYYGKNYERLCSIKRQYDLDNHIRHPQSIPIS